MAGTAERFSGILQKEIQVHAAWLPITNTFQVGDYGVISEGVFAKMGNIGEFGVGVETGDGPPATLDFKSAGTRVMKFLGEAEVNLLPDQPLDARLKVEFDKADSFLIKCNITSKEMKSMNQTAKALAAVPGWDKKFKIVSSTYSGEDCVVISTKEAKSVVEIGGKANALKQFDLGRLEAGLQFSSSKQLGLQIVGKSGVVGLKLFGFSFGGGIKTLTLKDAKVETLPPSKLEDDV